MIDDNRFQLIDALRLNWGCMRICAVTFSFCIGGRCSQLIFQRGCAMYADDTVLIGETVEGLRDKF